MPETRGEAERPVFRRRHRLAGRDAYAAVFREGVRKPAGPLMIHLRPNGLEEHRLGLSVGRKVGGAVRRVALKRRLREAFRLSRGQLPRAAEGAYDVVVSARAHGPATLVDYQRWLAEGMARAHTALSKRGASDEA